MLRTMVRGRGHPKNSQSRVDRSDQAQVNLKCHQRVIQPEIPWYCVCVVDSESVTDRKTYEVDPYLVGAFLFDQSRDRHKT